MRKVIIEDKFKLIAKLWIGFIGLLLLIAIIVGLFYCPEVIGMVAMVGAGAGLFFFTIHCLFYISEHGGWRE